MSIVERLSGKSWLLNYIKFKLENAYFNLDSEDMTHVIFLFVDHFEPKENTTIEAEQEERMRKWVEVYPKLALRHHDSDGFHPRHTWFYQVEDWEGKDRDIVYLRQLANLCFDGFGEVELHVHHGPPSNHYFPDVENSEKLAELIYELKNLFSQTGALITAESDAKRVFGFIHGKWALDNSLDGKYCGVNDELKLLSEEGCYADFTMPSGEDKSQSKKINSIYYATDDESKPKSYDYGIDVKVGEREAGDLMMFSGMLEIYFRNIFNNRSIIEKSNVDFKDLPSPARIDQWVRSNIHIKGQPRWVFVKIHTHGAREENTDVCLGDISEHMYSYLEEKYNDGVKYKLHYVTAREAYNIVKAAEAGGTGNPSEFRDYVIRPYANTKIRANVSYNLRSYTRNTCELNIIEKRPDTKLEFKELLLREINGGHIENIDYILEQDERQANVLLNGEGEVKCKFELPKHCKESNIIVSGAIVLENSNYCGNTEYWILTNLTGTKRTRISINW